MQEDRYSKFWVIERDVLRFAAAIAQELRQLAGSEQCAALSTPRIGSLSRLR